MRYIDPIIKSERNKKEHVHPFHFPLCTVLCTQTFAYEYFSESVRLEHPSSHSVSQGPGLNEQRGWTVPVRQMYMGRVSTAVCASSSHRDKNSSANVQRERSGAPFKTSWILIPLPAVPMATARQILLFPMQSRGKCEPGHKVESGTQVNFLLCPRHRIQEVILSKRG